MLKCGNQIRFTHKEIEKDRSLGLDISWIKTDSDLSAELIRWIELVAKYEPHVIHVLGKELEELGFSANPSD